MKISVFIPNEKLLYWSLVFVWIALSIQLWIWWSRPEHMTSIVMFVLSSFVLSWTTIIPGWFLIHAGRGVRTNPALKVPLGKFAMVVTKAPSEPWSIVQNTLEGMLSQDFPQAYNVWLADEDPSSETLQWCSLNDVKVSSRKGVAAYHQQSFPARTKCKEGNLRYWYDRYGYGYDFVAQLDADHKPEPEYLFHMMQPFADENVGYVAAPSVCDANTSASWTVRARLWMEAGFHGALQAGYNNGLVPLCIGSHYAVRTSALRSLVHPLPSGKKVIGGLAAELAEDHLTTVAMVTNGWQGAFALEAVAHGDGAVGFADAMTQEYQWSRSLSTILIRWWRYWLLPTSRLNAAQFLQLLFNQLWYPLFSAALLLGTILPIVALATDVPLMNADVLGFAWRFGLVQAAGFLPIILLRRIGLLRPVASPLLSWEVALFELVRWPWALLGVCHGLWAAISGQELPFKVTDKGKNQQKKLGFVSLLPYTLLFVVGTVATQVFEPKQAQGYVYFSLMTALMGVVAVIALVHQHRRENGMKSWKQKAVPAFIAVVGIVVISACTAELVRAAEQPLTPPWVEEFLFGAFDPEELLFNETPLIYQTWRLEDAGELAEQLADLPAEANTVIVTIEPHSWQGWWDMSDETLLTDIAAGWYDSTIESHCTVMERLDIPVIVRWGHEMELDRNPPWTGKEPAEFVAAYRRFVDTCRSVAPSLFYMWSPAGHPELSNYWPGSNYVDVIGITTLYYEEWNQYHYSTEVDFFSVFDHRYQRVKTFGKPVVIAELGVASNEKALWISDALAEIENYPLLRGMIYFNVKQADGAWGSEVPDPDWRVDPTIWPPPDQSR